MANDVFSIRDDMVIEFYVPTAGNWIWGVSQWDGGDVWGGSSSSAAWTDLKCEIASVQMEHGVELQQGVFPSPASTRATVVMQSAEYDPFTHGTIHTGTPVRIQINANPDSDPGFTRIFEGTVESFTSAYTAEGLNRITFTCVDFMQSFLNTPITSYTPTAPLPTPNDIIEELVLTYWPTSEGFSPALTDDFWYVTPSTWTDTTIGQIVRDCLIAGQGAFYTDQSTNNQIYRSANDLNNKVIVEPSWYFSTTHSSSPQHICYYDLNITADSRDLPTEVIATFDGGMVMSITNQDAFELYGSIALQTDVKINGATGAQLWLDNFNLTTRLRRVKSISFPAITRESKLRSFNWYNQLFSVCSVVYNLGDLNVNDAYFVTKESNTITPDGWQTTLELWRGI